jgi:hypothetical protein
LNSILLLLFAVLAGDPKAPDTLVVCPAQFRPTLSIWLDYRRGQGHEIRIMEPPASATALCSAIRRTGQAGQLKYVLLVGDVPLVPTNYAQARINTRWGSEPYIATDEPYSDMNDDGVPDLAIGRIPAHSADELAAVVAKVLRYEQQLEHGEWERKLKIISGVGGFGAVTDALVEGAARQVIQQTVPAGYDVGHLSAGDASLPADDFVSRARNQLSDGCLAWIYLGHGLPTELDRVQTANGTTPILSVSDVPRIHCGPQRPLAVLVACYTGAIDAPQDCLAEKLLLAGDGPVAVIAATRVTMPYGNTVLGYELLRACLHGKPAAMGDVLRLAQQRVLAASPDDQLRASLDTLAQGMSPSPVDLACERREHVWMYHLIGDPLLQLHRPAERVAKITTTGAITK